MVLGVGFLVDFNMLPGQVPIGPSQLLGVVLFYFGLFFFIVSFSDTLNTSKGGL